MDKPLPFAASPHAVPVGVAITVAALDQLTKAVIVATLGPERSTHGVELAGSLVAFRYVENRGAAFGLLRGQDLVLSLLALAVVAGLVTYYRRVAAPSPWFATGIGLVGGGAAGNLIDRARQGYVVDFVAVGTWPKFNVADSAITVGVLVLALHALLAERHLPARAATARGSAPSAGPTLPADG